MKIAIITSMSHLNNAWIIHNFLEKHGSNSVSIIFEPGFINYEDYDLIISYYFPHIIPTEEIAKPRYGTINCHPSLLPFNRGVYTNIYPIVEATPAGVSVHHLVASLDAGNVIAQREVHYDDYDTGETLYYKLENGMTALFIDTWPEIERHINECGCLPIGTSQTECDEEVTYHRKSDLARTHDLSSYFTMAEMTTIREFIDIVRASTFTGYDGAYITNEEGEKVYYKLTPYKQGENQ